MHLILTLYYALKMEDSPKICKQKDYDDCYDIRRRLLEVLGAGEMVCQRDIFATDLETGKQYHKTINGGNINCTSRSLINMLAKMERCATYERERKWKPRIFEGDAEEVVFFNDRGDTVTKLTGGKIRQTKSYTRDNTKVDEKIECTIVDVFDNPKDRPITLRKF